MLVGRSDEICDHQITSQVEMTARKNRQ